MAAYYDFLENDKVMDANVNSSNGIYRTRVRLTLQVLILLFSSLSKQVGSSKLNFTVAMNSYPSCKALINKTIKARVNFADDQVLYLCVCVVYQFIMNARDEKIHF